MNPHDLIALAISLCAALLALYGMSVVQHRRRIRSSRALLESISESSRIRTSSEQPESTPLPKTRLLLAITASRYGAWLRNLYARAGLWEESRLESGISQKIALAIAGAIAAAFLIQTSATPAIFSIALPFLAFFFPDLLMLRKSQDRVVAIAKSLPETIDLLAMCVGAGIGFHSGMQRVAASQENPLSQEFSRVLAEMKLGRSRSQALLNMSERLRIPTLTEFVNSILQVDRLGVPMARILEEQSKRMRTLRQEGAREQAQKLPVKLLAPIMLLMMPALLIIVLGPAVVSIARSFG